MKAYEAIKLLKADRKDFLKTHGIKSHMSNISKELEAELFGEEKKTQTKPEPTQTVDRAETVVVKEDVCETNEEKKPAEECPVDIETLKTSLRGGGNKSPYWNWRHLVNA